MATFLSYHDLQEQGILYSEAHALQYLINVGILRPHQYCGECQTYMELKSCPTARYSDGYNLAPTLPEPCPSLACPNLARTLLFARTLPQPCPDLAPTLPETLPQACPNLAPSLRRRSIKLPFSLAQKRWNFVPQTSGRIY